MALRDTKFAHKSVGEVDFVKEINCLFEFIIKNRKCDINYSQTTLVVAGRALRCPGSPESRRDADDN